MAVLRTVEPGLKRSMISQRREVYLVKRVRQVRAVSVDSGREVRATERVRWRVRERVVGVKWKCWCAVEDR